MKNNSLNIKTRNFIFFVGKSVTKPIDFGTFNKVYFDFFGKLNKMKFKIYFCNGVNNFLGDNKYFCKWIYNKEFRVYDKIIEPDVVLDRSTSLMFPDLLSNNVLNKLTFKLLEKNKWQSYLRYRQYFPLTKLVFKKEEILDYLDEFRSDKIIFKPFDGLCGKDITIIKKIRVKRSLGNLRYKRSFLMQEFLDTSSGILGVVKGIHDIESFHATIILK